MVHGTNPTNDEVEVIVRFDYPVKIGYYRAVGILPHVLATIRRMSEPASTAAHRKAFRSDRRLIWSADQ